MICYFKIKLCSVYRNESSIVQLHLRQKPMNKPVRATLGRTQTRFSSLPMHRQGSSFVYFMPYLANKPPKHWSGSRIFACCHAPPSPRKKWVVAAQPIPSEPHSSRARASNFPDQRGRDPFQTLVCSPGSPELKVPQRTRLRTPVEFSLVM